MGKATSITTIYQRKIIISVANVRLEDLPHQLFVRHSSLSPNLIPHSDDKICLNFSLMRCLKFKLLAKIFSFQQYFENSRSSERPPSTRHHQQDTLNNRPFLGILSFHYNTEMRETRHLKIFSL